jgi:hypothetical protein
MDGSGATLDDFFSLGKEYIRARYGRPASLATTADPNAQAVAIPATSTVQVQGDDAGAMSYVPVVVVAVVVAVLLGIALKKAG